MATRYSGSICIRVQYSEVYSETAPNGFYRVVVRLADGRKLGVIVKAPRCLDRAVDSSEAYDRVARAALAFLAVDCDDVDAQSSFDGRGFAVSRRRIPV